MALLKKRCTYCKEKINKGEEVWEKVKVPEFTGIRPQPFCNKEHAELYKAEIKGTPRRNFCPHCGV
jgi:hypothetical protein